MKIVKSSVIEHSESVIIVFFILQCAKFCILEPCYSFFDKICEVNKI